jgi:hypothetical protein
LTDKVPFYGVKELMVMNVLEKGVRPEKPDFLLTRGYTEELWEMTIRCWNEKYTERPDIDYVLERLKVDAERWEPPVGGEDYDDQTSWVESDSDVPSEREDQHDIFTDASSPPSHPSVTETPVPVATPSAL